MICIVNKYKRIIFLFLNKNMRRLGNNIHIVLYMCIICIMIIIYLSPLFRKYIISDIHFIQFVLFDKTDIVYFLLVLEQYNKRV